MSWAALMAILVPAVVGGVGYLLKTAVDNSARTIADTVNSVTASNLRIVEELQRSTISLTQGIDADLRERRLAVYQELWRLTEILPLYPERKPLTFEDLFAFSGELRDWYFRVGGVFLTEDARDGFFAVQKAIHAHTAAGASGPVDDDVYDDLRERCSVLRTELTGDLFSRRPPPSLVRAT